MRAKAKQIEGKFGEGDATTFLRKTPAARIIEAALAIKDAGLARAIMISSHHRPSFPMLAQNSAIDAIMVRYNAAHPGAEREVFPQIAQDGRRRVGVVAYTATRWGQL